MGEKIKISTNFEPELLKRIDAYANKRYTDRSAAIQQLVDIALRELNKGEVIKAYRDGRLSIRQCADMLGVDYFEMNNILQNEGISVIDEHYKMPEKTLEKINQITKF
ncbi:hypothetical protein Dtox_4068 [Desulfofarcimen acetoxidans DSM 771]|uniref:Ribbon-helix-helix protein CopG domain-containing protein n=1 Tax=Desulfofarcimen acetoxidans (strain ATCC 49208 / DSM 771 / KCTC 5769 / VKM B-1644 / 5575) TaxID=485916 RepID=C8VYM3_DESAS|nr:UPF0175 family protein [Desulfofarcimen acetoxidans]ACV64744.1 hypothetical protein Dtox_4068 [Desulfofarcimen acetoxidans DSM 771]